MIKYGILAAIFILVTTAVVATFQSSEEIAASSQPQSSLANTAITELEQRLILLEQGLQEERQLRLRLEQQIIELSSSGQVTTGSQDDVTSGNRLATLLELNGEALPEDLTALREQIEERRNAARNNTEERQIENLIEAGFDQYQAEEIIRQTEEMQMNLLNARFQASQSGEDFDAGQMQLEAIAELRANLGEADYERYLEATNQSTNVGVSNVLASSPAEIAGMQTGDQIISYNGERVFNVNDLNRLTNSVEASGNVVVEVLRDGQPVNLSLPTGPIGITSGRANRGR